ncbi:hypothetical protein TrLO_g5666 [Triparma laevis f. longispina]|uniref:Uncharacterized protein n=1 Tax=Triparma laevis f. longispina TaxID=1714387 RepID=A0A9W7C6F0_9STRA|nr:hypothetical protein TrLO_g5666 [Triparma laevis f. longispina]
MVYSYTQDSNGNYMYNTASSQVTVEVIKLIMSFIGEYYEIRNDNNTKFLSHLKTSISTSLTTKVFLQISFLTFSYLISNALIFTILSLTSPGLFSLFKSFTPVIVALLNYVIFKRSIEHSKIVVIFIMFFGIILATQESQSTPSNSSSSNPTIYLILIQLLISSLNMVTNGHLLLPSTTSLSINQINIMMYSLGGLLNFVLYFVHSSEKSFFEGYNSGPIYAFLFTKSLMGIIGNYVYRSSGSTIKSFASPIVTCICVFLSYLLLNEQHSLVSFCGSGVVILSAYLYLIL